MCAGRLSYYIDRDAIVEVAWSGASKVTPLPMPDYPPLHALLRRGQAAA